MTEIGDTESGLTDKIEFDGDAILPDSKSKLVSFKHVLSRGMPDNPAPSSELNFRPDIGFSGSRYELNLLFDEQDQPAKAIKKLSDWFSERNVIRGKFKNGRIGIRNNYRPEFNLLPDNFTGYKLVHFETNTDLLIHTEISAFLVLEFSGSPDKLGV